MAKRSAGLLLYRFRGGRDDDGLEVLIAHPGGPYWAHKDDGAWSIPKGEYGDGEDAWHAARREFTEEVGRRPPDGPPIALGEARQAGGKTVTAFAVRGDLDPADASSNTFDIEWPPHSGHRRSFPEVDRVAWFTVADASVKLLVGQRPFLDRLLVALAK